MFTRSMLTAAVILAPLLVMPAARALESTAVGVTVQSYDPLTAQTQFSIPIPGVEEEADESLVFHFQVNPTQDIRTSDVQVNGHKLDIEWASYAKSSKLLLVFDSAGIEHIVNVSWIGVIATPRQELFANREISQNVYFRVAAVDGTLASAAGFIVIMRPTAEQRLLGIIPYSGPALIRFNEDGSSSVTEPSEKLVYRMEAIHGPDNGEDELDLPAELEELRLLNTQAEQLQLLIKGKKKKISQELKQHREKLCLKHLIQECDGVICAAKAVVERLCDKMGIKVEPSASEYAKIKDFHVQHEVAFNEKGGISAQGINVPLVLTKNTAGPNHEFLDRVYSPNPFIRILQIIAAILGLSALFAIIKRKCMSARKRVERAADLEERRNARAYRRAARRALMRKRWDNFAKAINCFGQRESRADDYEEKRALILQDALLEQDLDQAEKGEVMEAEIRELRYAHEIVSSLVRVEENRYAIIAPVNDPPPPLVPLPYTPATRSRASTYTLPSYTSESLPDYSSRPAGDSTRSNSLVEFTPMASENDATSRSERSGHTGLTLMSSVIETTPRPSGETLGRRQSGES